MSLYVFLLSLVQGLTEPLPVSSSAHTGWLLYYFPVSKMIFISASVGSTCGLFWALRHYFYEIITSKQLLLKYIIYLFISLGLLSLGFLLLGFLAKTQHTYLISLVIVGSFAGTFLLYLADKRASRFTQWHDTTYSQIIIIGLFQILSLIPGMSRSGMCMVGAKFCGLTHKQSYILAFLLGIPVLILANFHVDYIPHIETSLTSIISLIGAFTISGLTAYGVCHWFLRWLEAHGLKLIIIYRLCFASALLIWEFW